MALYPRLLGLEQPQIQVHQFWAALGEYRRGKFTVQQVIDLFTLSPSEQTEAQTLLSRLVDRRESISLGMVPAGHVLTNVGSSYDAIVGSQNLGFAQIQLSGMTQVVLNLRVNKVGSGTQSWQLWNETDNGEILVIDDTGAAGLKYLTGMRDFTTPLAAGLKYCRLRVKSTTAQDDPVYYGAALSLAYMDVLTSFEGHEVGMISDLFGSPYHNEAALKARLGV